MFDFYEKRKIKALLFSKFSILVIFLLTVWLLVSVYDRYQMERVVSERRSEQSEKRDVLQARASALEGKIAYFKSDKGIEEELRDRYGVVREGEQVIILLEDEESEGEEVSNEEPSSFFDFLFFWR